MGRPAKYRSAPIWLTVATKYVTGLVDLAELTSSGPIPLAGDSG